MWDCSLNGFDLPALRNPHTLPDKHLGAHMKGFASRGVREWGWLTACCSSSLCLVSSIWEGKGSHRSALSLSRPSGRPSVVLETQGTENNLEAIIAKCFLSLFHLSQQQEGRDLSSHRCLIPLDISGNKALKYFGESGSETHCWNASVSNSHHSVCLFGKVISDTHYHNLLQQAQYFLAL